MSKKVDEYKRMLNEGWDIDFIARDFGVSVEAVYRALLRDKKKEAAQK